MPVPDIFQLASREKVLNPKPTGKINNNVNLSFYEIKTFTFKVVVMQFTIILH